MWVLETEPQSSARTGSQSLRHPLPSFYLFDFKVVCVFTLGSVSMHGGKKLMLDIFLNPFLSHFF